MSRQKPKAVFNRISFILVILIVASIFSLGLTIFNRGPSKIHQSIGTNEQINYQARLLTPTGAVVPDGSYNIEFKIYQDGDGVMGGGDETLKWTETRIGGNKVLVKNGYFSVYLGSVTSFGSNVNWNQDTLWLSIDVEGTGGSPTFSDEMTPYTRFSSTPYALNSKALGGLTSDNFVKLAQGVQADVSTTNSSIFINKTGATSNILQLQKNAIDVLTVANNGAATFQNSADSATAFQIQNAAGTSLLIADSSNLNLRPGVTATTSSASLAVTEVDNSASVGQYSSIAIGTDGLPVISYYDSTNFTLRVTKCGNAACSSGNTSTKVDNSASVGTYTYIAIGTDGLPVISYYDR